LSRLITAAGTNKDISPHAFNSDVFDFIAGALADELRTPKEERPALELVKD
jgi:hypothetical protein